VDSRGRLTYNETDKVWERVFPGKENHVDFFVAGRSPRNQPKPEVYRLSLTVRITEGEWAESDLFRFGIIAGWSSYSIKGLAADWQTFTQDFTVPATTWPDGAVV
jgi:hypothetical protein